MLKSSLAIFLFAISSLLAADTPPQPIYIYLTVRIDDHVNTGITAERIKRTLALLEKVRREHPAANVSALIQFSGATVQALSDQNAKEGLVDLLRKAEHSGLIEAGYAGANEPAYFHWQEPPADQLKLGLDERWGHRSAARAHFLTEHEDPLTGNFDAARPGGLREVEQVFGPVVSMRDASPDVGGDPELIHLLQHTHDKLILLGLPDPAINPAVRKEGYFGLAHHFPPLIGPAPDTAPEMYWMNDVLHLSEYGGDPPVRSVDASLGVTGMKKILESLDRTHPHVLRVELSAERLYLTEAFVKSFFISPLKYAYNHTDKPELPGEDLRPREDVDEAYERQENLLQFLTSQFFTANPGSRFVSSTALLGMTSPAAGFEVKKDTLVDAAHDLLKRWGQNTNVPNFVLGGGRYFSIADMFQLMAAALSEKQRSGKLPEQVRLNQVYAPLEFTDEFGTGIGSVSASGVLQKCSELAADLNQQEWSAEPRNIIPGFVKVDGESMNAGAFLRIMAQALTMPDAAKFDIGLAVMSSAMGMNYPHTRARKDFGGVWTLKPAPLQIAK